jgi:uncharacterized 2Fe-2S/4Fe-4S cluster protein (DUF4445 family)
MHHLLLRLPVGTLAELPFQPTCRDVVRLPLKDAAAQPLWARIFPPEAEVVMPPLVGGFVGSDALACLLHYGFDRAEHPMAAIDLGTNGEVLVTDGRRILAASTAAGPAFEGLAISCGTRAVDGAIIASVVTPDGAVQLSTIGDQPPVGLAGSGLISLVAELRRVGVIEPSGRLLPDHPVLSDRIDVDGSGVRRLLVTDRGVDRTGLEDDAPGITVALHLTQPDIRELQKAKAAIRATIDTLLARLGLVPVDLGRVILTGSFGSQIDAGASLDLGMLPGVPPGVIEASANGAGLGAALMLDDAQLARAGRIAEVTEQVDLDLDPGFQGRFVQAMSLMPGG